MLEFLLFLLDPLPDLLFLVDLLELFLPEALLLSPTKSSLGLFLFLFLDLVLVDLELERLLELLELVLFLDLPLLELLLLFPFVVVDFFLEEAPVDLDWPLCLFFDLLD